MSNGRIDFANALRGFAALAVVVAHYFGVFWSNREVVELLTNAPALSLQTHATPRYLSWIHAFSIFNWGPYGVAIFFVISGFVIPFSFLKNSSVGFIANRIIRIFPTYIVGFSITLLAIFISSNYFSREWPFSMREVLLHYIPGIRDLLWSKDIDGIIWTLEIEMKFYILCAIFATWFRIRSLNVLLLPVGLFVVTMYVNTYMPHWGVTNASAYKLAFTLIKSSQYIIFMFIGVVFNFMYTKKINQDFGYLLIASLFCLFCIHWYYGPTSQAFYAAWSYGLAILTFMFAYAFSDLFKANRFFDFFADISYPLYVVHGVAGYVALRILLENGFKAWVSLLIVTSGCILVSWLLHKFIEVPSQKLSKVVGEKISNIFSVKPINV